MENGKTPFGSFVNTSGGEVASGPVPIPALNGPVRPTEVAVTMDESNSLQQADRLLASVQDEERQEFERQLGDPEDVREPDELDPPDERLDAARTLIQGVMWNINSDPEDVLRQTRY